MYTAKSKKIVIYLSLLFASAIILCAVNPTPVLLLYRTVYVKYVRLAKHDFATRFSDQDLALAISHAQEQPWVQKQIQGDLAPFKQGINSAQVNRWFKDFQSQHNKLAKFTVKNNVVTVNTPAEYKSSRAYKTIFGVISLLASKGQIPDCEFVIALNDYLSYIPANAKPAAILSFAKHSQLTIEKNTILVPDWMNVRYWDVLRGRIAFASKLYPWKRKENTIFWRGGTTDSMLHRAQLMQLKPKLKFLNVGMTEGDHAVPYMAPENSLVYKYQLAMDGARCTWERMVWQMAANTILIKPNSPQIQWFHYGLEPYKNYVPIKTIDEINITAVYEWLRTHDAEAKQIMQNANAFAKENFKTQDFFAYYALVLQEYAKLFDVSTIPTA